VRFAGDDDERAAPSSAKAQDKMEDGRWAI
jgi:hypothetical protein